MRRTCADILCDKLRCEKESQRDARNTCALYAPRHPFDVLSEPFEKSVVGSRYDNLELVIKRVCINRRRAFLAPHFRVLVHCRDPPAAPPRHAARTIRARRAPLALVRTVRHAERNLHLHASQARAAYAISARRGPACMSADAPEFSRARLDFRVDRRSEAGAMSLFKKAQTAVAHNSTFSTFGNSDLKYVHFF